MPRYTVCRCFMRSRAGAPLGKLFLWGRLSTLLAKEGSCGGMGANEGVCEYLRSCFLDSFLENSNILFTSLKRFSSLSQCVLVYNTLSPLYRCLHLGLGFRCHRFIKREVGNLSLQCKPYFLFRVYKVTHSFGS